MPAGCSQYCNPLLTRNVPDPFILPAEGGFWLFGTGSATDGRFITVFRSDDLARWEFVGGAVQAGPGRWNRRNFWAPEVLVHDGRCWLYYTAMPADTPGNTGNRVGVAVADRPEGPYEDRGVVIEHASLDGSPFRDADGSLYLYYTAEFGSAEGMTPGRIYVDRLVEPGRSAGRPVELIGQHPWQEGPCLLGHDGTYYLFYSAGNWGDASYQVRWAVGDSPAGPFVEQPGPLLASTEQVKGPGHNNFFRSADGSEWIVYHGWPADFTVGRLPRIDRLIWREGRPHVDGPTVSPQPLSG